MQSKRRSWKDDHYGKPRRRSCNYISGLTMLSEAYDDKELLSFVADLKESGLYKESFEKSVLLAKKRNVPEDETIKSKAEIDAYFQGGSL